MKILISGAGIAGLSSARELAARGHDVTIVEYADGLRLRGTPIDIRGDAIEAAARLGLLDRIRDRRVRMSEQTWFVDADGEPVAPLPLEEINDSDDDIEILREDLVRILAEAVPDAVRIRFGESVDALSDDGDGVDVRLVSGGTERYDLVIGADGQHSGVRRLTFGPDREHLLHLGVYFALADHPGEAHGTGRNAIHNVPGRMAGLLRYGGRAVAVFAFRSPEILHDHRDTDAQKTILAEAYTGHDTWRIPELLDVARADARFYLSAAAQIHMPTWHRGRVVLVGDAGYCPAFLSGRGTSLALLGARILAEELDRHPGDHAGAFQEYETRQRPYVAFAQDSVDGGRDRLVPATWDAIAARNQALQAVTAGPA